MTPIPFGAVLIDSEGNRYFKAVTEELDVLLSSGMSDDLMSRKIGWC